MGKFNSLGLIVISGALFLLFTKPQMTQVEQLNERKAAYNQAISDMQQIDQRKNELLAKLNNFPEEDVAKIDTLLPDKPNVVALVAELENVASKHGIVINNINTNTGNFSSSVGGDASQKNYESAQVSFDFESTYERMKLFMMDIESSLRILDIRSIDFSAGLGNNFVYKVTLEIYWVSPKVQAQVMTSSPIMQPL